MDLDYWKQRALDAEQSLKEGAGTAADTVRRGVDMGKAKLGFDNNEPLTPQITEPAGQAVDDLKTLFLDTLVPGEDPTLQRPQPGQREAPADPSLNRPQPGQRADAPGDMERALKAAEEAFNSVMQGAGNAASGVGDAVGAAAQPFQDFGEGFMGGLREGVHTGGMNRALGDAGMPPVPPRDPNDPYFGREYPRLQRPQPGQDWDHPDNSPIRGEEIGWPWYMPQVGPNGRPKAPLPPAMGGSGRPIRRT